jgi:LuxR family maltose regulon positive regulatory protein
LATLYLREGRNPRALTEFDGEVGHIPGYLAAEVLAGVPRRIKRFLLRTSVLRSLSAGLCNAVMGQRGSGEILAALELSNLFVVRLDESGRWYRYHPLFADWLRGQLEREAPDSIPALHRRAARWYRSQAMPEEAFDHAMAAEDIALAAEIVASYYWSSALAGRGETVRRWLESFDEKQIQEYPHLALAGAWVAAAMGDAHAAAARLRAAERGDQDGPSLEGGATFGSAVLTLRALLGQQGVASLRRDAETAYRLERSRGGVYDATAACLAGIGRFLNERGRTGARELLEEAVALGRKDKPGAQASALALLALLAAQADRWDEAHDLVTTAKKVVDDRRLSDIKWMACVHAILALTESQRGQRDAARTHLDLARQTLPLLAPFPWLAAVVAIVSGWSASLLGDPRTARSMQREAGHVVARMSDAGRLTDWVDDLRAGVSSGDWPGPRLTPSELRVLQKLTTFRSLSDIGTQLFVSANTVKSHARSIYRKLEVTSRAEAVARARTLGLVDS